MYTCANCGYQSVKWLGRCPQCGEWESFAETKPKAAQKKVKSYQPFSLSQLKSVPIRRLSSGLSEFDRVLGGGVLKGEVVLLGGEPGIGKSTLLLETASFVSQKEKVLYVSAEESAAHISLRAKRLGLDKAEIYIVEGNEIESIVALAEKEKFGLVIIDSIQAVKLSSLGSAAGSLSQIRDCAFQLTETAKKCGFSLFIVGHITKEGMLAGPKILEHMVDCVIYFEGERNSELRILRAVKNRFGSVGEIGVFKMTEKGILPAENTASFFISPERRSTSGYVLSCITEGRRVLFLEVQALVARSDIAFAKRKVSGADFNRFSILLAMLEKKLRLNLGHKDVFVNIPGGIKTKDSALDLALAVAIVSAYRNKPVPSDYVFLAELGLGGELRRIGNVEARIKAAQEMGFKKVFIPQANAAAAKKKWQIEIEARSDFLSVIKSLGLFK